MKRLCAVLLTAVMCMGLVGCVTDSSGKSTQDIIGEYAGKIEDAKEELEEGLDKLQKAVDEVIQNVPGK